MRFTFGNTEPDVAVYRVADTCQAEVVSNAFEAAGLSYHRRAEVVLGFCVPSTGLPDERLGEMFYVPRKSVDAARKVLAALPFPPPDGQPVCDETEPPQADDWFEHLPPSLVAGILATVALVVLVLIANVVLVSRGN